MRISVFGLGYVGCTTAAHLAELGHRVIGVDVNPDKAALVNAGRAPIVEPGLEPILAEQTARERLTATTECAPAIRDSELSFLCVGTPSADSGQPDLGHVLRVAEEVGAALAAERRTGHVVVLRSTVAPGTTERHLIPALERASGLRAGHDLLVAYQPEFLRQGSAVADVRNPPKIVVGATDPEVARRVADVYRPGPQTLVHLTSYGVAEAVKYVDNAFHAMKVAFANEIGLLCRGMGVESQQVTDIFLQDRKLNISPAYLRPGFAFGGSCLPKDLRALLSFARQAHLDVPVLEAILDSNAKLVERAVTLIDRLGSRRVGVLGLSFKSGTDDLRESPVVELVERLVGKGFELSIHDARVNLSRLTGANLAYITRSLPHLQRLLRDDVESVLAASDTIVVGHHDVAYRDILEQRANGHVIVDLPRIFAAAPASIANYRALV